MKNSRDFFVSLFKTIFLWFWPSLIIAMIFISKIKISRRMMAIIFFVWFAAQFCWFMFKASKRLGKIPKDPTVEVIEKEVP